MRNDNRSGGSSSGGQPRGLTLYSATELARELRCSEWWVKEQARRRRIPFLMVGGAYRFTADHLVEIVRLCEVRPEVGELARPAGASGPRPRTHRVDALVAGLRARPPRRARRIAEQSDAA